MSKRKKTESKKSRKPYTITKPRESWTKDEHQRFVEALKLYERDWKKIGTFVRSKSVIQIRSHAQKYFIKMQKLGRTDCIPPPRPKRKSKKPYPKTQSKKAKKVTTEKTKTAEKNSSSGSSRKRRKTSKRAEPEPVDAEEEEEETTQTLPHHINPTLHHPHHLHHPSHPQAQPHQHQHPHPHDETYSMPPHMHGQYQPPYHSSRPHHPHSHHHHSSHAYNPHNHPHAHPRVHPHSHSHSIAGPYGGSNAAGREDAHSPGVMMPGGGPMGHHFPLPPPSSSSLIGMGGPILHNTHNNHTLPLTHPHNINHSIRPGAANSGLLNLNSPSPGSGASSSSMASTIGGGEGGEAGANSNSMIASGGDGAAVNGSNNTNGSSSGALHPQSVTVTPSVQWQRVERQQMQGLQLQEQNQAQYYLQQAISQHHQNGGGSGAGLGGRKTGPEFSKVYSFLGSLFDPSTSGHLEQLESMDEVDREIVQVLMRNLAANLNSHNSLSNNGSDGVDHFSTSEEEEDEEGEGGEGRTENGSEHQTPVGTSEEGGKDKAKHSNSKGKPKSKVEKNNKSKAGGRAQIKAKTKAVTKSPPKQSEKGQTNPNLNGSSASSSLSPSPSSSSSSSTSASTSTSSSSLSMSSGAMMNGIHPSIGSMPQPLSNAGTSAASGSTSSSSSSSTTSSSSVQGMFTPSQPQAGLHPPPPVPLPLLPVNSSGGLGVNNISNMNYTFNPNNNFYAPPLMNVNVLQNNFNPAMGYPPIPPPQSNTHFNPNFAQAGAMMHVGSGTTPATTVNTNGSTGPPFVHQNGNKNFMNIGHTSTNMSAANSNNSVANNSIDPTANIENKHNHNNYSSVEDGGGELIVGSDPL